MSDDKKHPEEEVDKTESADEATEDTSEETSEESSSLSGELGATRDAKTADDVDAEESSDVDASDDDEDNADVDASDDETDVSTDTDGEVIEDSIDDSDGSDVVPPTGEKSGPGDIKGIAAFFDLPDDLMLAAAHTRDSEYEAFEAYSPFPIHGMDDAMGLGRSWIPWVTFSAGTVGLLTAIALQFGTMTFDWPMIIGGKPYLPWPSFIPVMFELTVLFAGISSALIMLIAAGCFRKPFIIDREITQDRFALWISSDDEAFDVDKVTDFLKTLEPVEIRTITKGA